MGLRHRFGFASFAVAAAIGCWLATSTGAAYADGGGLLGGVLSPEDSPAEESGVEAEVEGLLDSVTDTASGTAGTVEEVDHLVGGQAKAEIPDESNPPEENIQINSPLPETVTDLTTALTDSSEDSVVPVADSNLQETVGTAAQALSSDTDRLPEVVGTSVEQTVATTSALVGAASVDIDPLLESGTVELVVESSFDLAETTVAEIESAVPTATNLARPAIAPALQLTEKLTSELVESLLETATQDLDPLLDSATNLVSPVTAPAFQVTEEVKREPLPSLGPVPAFAGPVVAQTGDISSARNPSWLTTDPGSAALRPQRAPSLQARIMLTSVAGPAGDLAQSGEDSQLRQDVAEEQHQPYTPGNSASGPLTWMASWFETAEGGAPASFGALSAILAGFIGLFLAPAIAAWAFVAVHMPRSPYYLPVHPPD